MKHKGTCLIGNKIHIIGYILLKNWNSYFHKLNNISQLISNIVPNSNKDYPQRIILQYKSEVLSNPNNTIFLYIYIYNILIIFLYIERKDLSSTNEKTKRFENNNNK